MLKSKKAVINKYVWNSVEIKYKYKEGSTMKGGENDNMFPEWNLQISISEHYKHFYIYSIFKKKQYIDFC